MVFVFITTISSLQKRGCRTNSRIMKSLWNMFKSQVSLLNKKQGTTQNMFQFTLEIKTGKLKLNLHMGTVLLSFKANV